MSEERIIWYLDRQIRELENKITGREITIKGMKQDLETYREDIKIWKIHYTSLMNTRLAYESEEQ